MPRSIHVSRWERRCSLAAPRDAWHARADQRHVTRTTQRSWPAMDSQRKMTRQLLLGILHGLVSFLITVALIFTAFVAHFAQSWQSVSKLPGQVTQKCSCMEKREDCVVGDDNSEEDNNMPLLTRQNGRSRSSSTQSRTPAARQRPCVRRIRNRRTMSLHILCCPTENKQGARGRHCHEISPHTLDKKGTVIADCDPPESSQGILCASGIQTSSRHERHFPAGFTETSSPAEEQIEDTEPDGTGHLEGPKSDATSKEACRPPSKKSKEMEAVHECTHGSDAEGDLSRKVTDISLRHRKHDVSRCQGEINDSLWKVNLGICVCQSDPASEAFSYQNSTRDRARVYYTDFENGGIGECHEGGEGHNAKEGGQQQTHRGNSQGGYQDKSQGYKCRTEAAGGLRGSGSSGDGGGDDDDDRGRKDDKRKMDEYLHLKKKRKKKKLKKGARAVEQEVTEMTSDGAGTRHVQSGAVNTTAARSSSKCHSWLVNHVSDGDDAVHHTDVLPPPPPPLLPPQSACVLEISLASVCPNDDKTLLPQSEGIPSENAEVSSFFFSAGPKLTSQVVSDIETQPFGHYQPQPIAAEDIVTQPFNSDQWKTTACCSLSSHKYQNALLKYPQQCEEDLQGERDLVSCRSQPISSQGELVQISLLEDALAVQTSTGQPAELKEVPGLHDISPVEVQLKRPQQCVEDLTLNGGAMAPPGHHGDGHILHHDLVPQQAHNQRAVRSQITIRPNVVLVEKNSHDALREILWAKQLENWYLRRRYRCQKCWTNNFTLVLCPCGHLLCRACGHLQTCCPVCNLMVESENFASFF